MGLLIWMLAGLALAAAGLRHLRRAAGAPGRAGGLARASSAPGENRTGQEPALSGRARPPRPAVTSRAAASGRGVGWPTGRRDGRRRPEARPTAGPWPPAPIAPVRRAARGRCMVGTASRVRLVPP